MPFQRLITQWLAARAMETVKRRAIKEIFSPPEDDRPDEATPLTCVDLSESDENRDAPETTDIGFVFAMPMEAAGVADRLKRKKTTRGNGRTFHTGLFGDFRVALVESGVGPEKAASATEALLDVFRPRRVLSAGYGGALSKRLKRFNVCFPEMLVRQSDGAKLDLSGPLPRRVDSPGPVEGRLALLTTDFVVASPKHKRALRQETGAELVDMETFAVADTCLRYEVPFLSIRIILDTASEELPKDIQKIMKDAEIGGARLAGTVLGSLLSRPSSMIDLFSLKQRALEATDRLAKRIAAELRPE